MFFVDVLLDLCRFWEGISLLCCRPYLEWLMCAFADYLTMRVFRVDAGHLRRGGVFLVWGVRMYHGMSGPCVRCCIFFPVCRDSILLVG